MRDTVHEFRNMTRQAQNGHPHRGLQSSMGHFRPLSNHALKVKWVKREEKRGTEHVLACFKTLCLFYLKTKNRLIVAVKNVLCNNRTMCQCL